MAFDTAAGGVWPRFNLPGYTMTIDFAAPAMRDDRRLHRTPGVDVELARGAVQAFGAELHEVGYGWLLRRCAVSLR